MTPVVPLLALAIAVLVSRPARGDDTPPPTLHGPGTRDYVLRADCAWDVVDRESGAKVARLPAPRAPRAQLACDSTYDAAVSPDEAWLASPGGIWSVRARRYLGPLRHGWGFAFSRSSRYLAYVDVPPPRSPDDIYGRRGRVVLLDLRLGTTRTSPRVLGPLSNSSPLSFTVSPPGVLVTDYALTIFSLSTLAPSPIDWKRRPAIVEETAP